MTYLPILGRNGAYRTCGSCRFWSELIAMSNGGPVKAMCLSDGKLSNHYTASRQSCEAWKSGHLGAVDDPGTEGTEYDGEPDDAFGAERNNQGEEF